MMVTVLVKGNRKNATRAAQRRGITLAKCKLNPRGDAVFCEAACGYREKIVKWYNEYSPLRKRGGYRPGTLLVLSDRCKR